MQDHTPQLPLFTTAPNDPTKEIPYGYCRCGCGQLAPRARANDKTKGHIKGEPLRFAIGHSKKCSPVVRFWKKVDKRTPDECWMWKGSLSNRYGALHVDGKEVRASRFSYELHYGPISDGLCVLHHCDTPGCVNPNHLWLGTQLENVHDRDRKGRTRTPNGINRNIRK